MNFLLIALKIVVTMSKRQWSLTRGSKYSDLTVKVLVFLKNWSLRRGGRKGRFDCTLLVPH